MSKDEPKSGYVGWTVFAFIIMLIFSIAAWYANMTSNKLDYIVNRVDDIDNRTSFLEGLTASQKTSFKAEINNLLTRMYGKQN